ncbi:hypothetical protein [Caldanaerovirga acetigignens]|nr:hypothetical protein [Caldanaerovirga acetigignens]
MVLKYRRRWIYMGEIAGGGFYDGRDRRSREAFIVFLILILLLMGDWWL